MLVPTSVWRWLTPKKEECGRGRGAGELFTAWWMWSREKRKGGPGEEDKPFQAVCQ